MIQTGALANSFVNADKADNYGVELEVRKNLDFLSPSLWPVHRLRQHDADAERDHAGQHRHQRAHQHGPAHGGPGGVCGERRADATPAVEGSTPPLLYNVVGARIVEAGAIPFPDAYEQARNLLDFSLQVPVFQSASLKLDAKNLLDDPVHVVQGGVTRCTTRRDASSQSALPGSRSGDLIVTALCSQRQAGALFSARPHDVVATSSLP